ncbi:MAG: hypothetical protein J1E95_10260, partial [Muribaculaceae bacterium]|nr:hypothetical protein [Muribaculaceae bacterium]
PPSPYILDYKEFKEKFRPLDCKVFVAIGYLKCNYYRELVSRRLMVDGYELVNYISPKAICWNGTLIGKNIFIADNVFIGHGCKVHDGVIIYEGCTFSHDAEIESYCFFSLSVSLGGYTKIGNNSFIGINATIKDGIKIGPYNIIGCASNVIRSTENSNLTIGNPGISKLKDTMNINI